ncbi:MAG: HlyD family type I secretion periplasmic adaptor subunit [Gammaproteobacteria bacterium]|nr:HlyD family type I secretion periplasmic adaptor subunit [Gammaproteobacteria bacterium]
MVHSVAEPTLQLVASDPVDTRGTIRIGMTLIAVAFVGFGGWASFVPLSGAVIAPGVVKVEANRKTVQHLEGGIVSAINVRDGDHVVAGQTLLELQSENVSASVEILSGQRDVEIAKHARLHAERELAEEIEFPAALVSRNSQPGVAALIEGEGRFFKAKRAALNGQKALLARQIGQSRDEIAALGEQVAAEGRAIELYREELTANQTLERKQFVQKTHMLGLQRGIEEYKSRRSEHLAEIARAMQRITDLELRAVSLGDKYVQDAAAELTVTQAKLFDLEERIRPSRDALQRQQITAPIAGTVVGLSMFTVGGVIRAGDPVLDIVPTENVLIVEAQLSVQDIDEVQLGSVAELRLPGLDYRTTPLLTGLVKYISADRLVDEASGAPYYSLHVEADKDTLNKLQGYHLSPGMPAEVYVKTRNRTALQYWLKPLRAVLRRTMRET